MPTTLSSQSSPGIEAIIQKHKGTSGALLKVLENVQEEDPKHYLSESSMRSISSLMGLPLSQVYSMATFYSFFNLKPRAGTPSSSAEARPVTPGDRSPSQRSSFENGNQEFKEEEENSATSLDGFASIRTVACFGQCALAPVVMIDAS
jgi:NADH-quinone oxidoreductase subunit E